MRLARWDVPASLSGSGSRLLSSFLVLARLDVGLLDLRLSNALVEFLNAAGGVEELLLAGVERVAVRAHFDGNCGQG